MKERKHATGRSFFEEEGKCVPYPLSVLNGKDHSLPFICRLRHQRSYFMILGIFFSKIGIYCGPICEWQRYLCLHRALFVWSLALPLAFVAVCCVVSGISLFFFSDFLFFFFSSLSLFRNASKLPKQHCFPKNEGDPSPLQRMFESPWKSFFLFFIHTLLLTTDGRVPPQTHILENLQGPLLGSRRVRCIGTWVCVQRLLRQNSDLRWSQEGRILRERINQRISFCQLWLCCVVIIIRWHPTITSTTPSMHLQVKCDSPKARATMAVMIKVNALTMGEATERSWWTRLK